MLRGAGSKSFDVVPRNRHAPGRFSRLDAPFFSGPGPSARERAQKSLALQARTTPRVVDATQSDFEPEPDDPDEPESLPPLEPEELVEELEYRSEYQPPPLRMNPGLREI